VFAKLINISFGLFSVAEFIFKVVIIISFNLLVYLKDDSNDRMLQYYAKQSTTEAKF